MSKIATVYYEKISSLLQTIAENEQESLDRGAAILAKCVMDDRLINVIGPGGHSNLAAEEVLWRAGGLVPVNPILDPGTSLFFGAKRSNYIERTPGYAKAVLDSYLVGKNDVLIIVNAYGINAMSIDCALECQKRGATSIGITSTVFANSVPQGAVSRHPNGQNLYQIVDLFIDTHLPLGDAVVEIEGLRQKMGATSTYVNAFTINLLMMRTVEKLLEQGVTPPVWTSANLPDGDKLNKEYEQKYLSRIKHLQ
jgi:uncharacterized phosphosugar-binding protein